jgi:hypothetical protein
MFDTAQDARPLIGNLGLVGCVAVGRYLFAGATDAQGNVPEPVATPVTADEIAAIHAAGLAVLLIDNGIGSLDAAADYARGQAKAQAAAAQAKALGCPAGLVIAADLEAWDATPDFLHGYCDAMATAEYKVMLYGSQQAGWRTAWEQASGQWPACADVLCWTARYVAWDGTGTPPPFAPEDDGGAKTVAWQASDQGPRGVDVSEILPQLLPLLWGAQQAPQQTPASSSSAILTALDRAAAAADQLRAALDDARKAASS